MFSQASVILFTVGGGVYPIMHWGRHPPGIHPPGRQPPPGQTHLLECFLVDHNVMGMYIDLKLFQS